MSQSAFENLNSILEIWKNIIQCVMFLVLWATLYDGKKEKRDGIAAALFVFANVGFGILPCAAWVRYGVLALAIISYVRIFDQRQTGKAVFAILAVYNLHCLSYLVANSIYVEWVKRLVLGIDFLQKDSERQMYDRAALGMLLLVVCYSVLFVVMVLIVRRLLKEIGRMTWQDVALLSVLNFVGSMITNIFVELYVVELGEGAFVLFDEKQELLWKLPMIAVFIFAGAGISVCDRKCGYGCYYQ